MLFSTIISASPPIFNSLNFNSINELIYFASSDEVDEVVEYIEKFVNSNGLFKNLISDIQTGTLYVPHHQGKEISYQNQEGFYNISLFPNELYNNPWIWYFPMKNKVA
jgi:hypothetical protein